MTYIPHRNVRHDVPSVNHSLLPDSVGHRLQIAQRPVHLPGGLHLHAGQQMAVGIQRESHRPVPEPLRDDLGVNALPQHVARVSVAQIMKPNPRQVAQLQLPAKLGAEGVRRPGRAVGPRDDQVVVLAA